MAVASNNCFPYPNRKSRGHYSFPPSCPREPRAREGAARQEDCGCLLLHPTAVARRRLAQRGVAGCGPGRCGKCVTGNETSRSTQRRRSGPGAHLPPLPSLAPRLPLSVRWHRHKLFPLLFSPAQFPCVPLNHKLTLRGLLRNTDPSSQTASSRVICGDYLFPDNTQGPFQTQRRKHSRLWADSYK